MKKLTALLAAGLVLGASGMAMALGAGDTATATGVAATATVITPISIAKTVDLAFGNIVAAVGGGTVVVPAKAGTITRTGTAALMPIAPGTVTAAEFTATGQSGAAYTVTVPVSGAVENTTGTGAETMALSAFTSKLADGIAAPGTLTSGSEVFYVGATLAVAAAQVPGDYVGTFDVSVNYN